MKTFAGRVLILILVLGNASLQVWAQFAFRPDASIPVKVAESSLTNAWAGGINSAQINKADLNVDGIEELVIFDRMTSRFLVFEWVNNNWVLAPKYEDQFPEDVQNWVILRDFNCDGRKDLFTGDALGMNVYQNESTADEIKWKRYLFYTGFPGEPKSEALLTKGFSTLVNLQLQSDDLPDIRDADEDGDLDIINIRFASNGTVEYHRNYSMERYGTCDSLEFERVTQKWGKFTECGCGNFAFNDEPCQFSGGRGGRVDHVGGKSVLLVDGNGDGVKDLLFAESSCSQLYFLPNDGTLENPVINRSSGFPGSTPVNLPLYPSAYLEDINNDGVPELLASPNLYARTDYAVNFSQSIWAYEKSGAGYELDRKNFLQSEMIDHGDQVIPALTDVDGDEDLDLLVATNQVPGTVVLYRNTGSVTQPAFELLNEDYLGFSAASLYNLKLQFTDFDNNNTTDLLFSGISLFDGTQRMYFLANSSSVGLNFSGGSAVELPVTLSGNENFASVDVELDGLPDLLIGKGNGSITFLRRTSINPVTFESAQPGFRGFTSSVTRQFLAFAFGDLNGDGQEDMVLGDQTGNVSILEDFRNADVSQVIANVIVLEEGGDARAMNLGGRIWPQVANLTNANKPDILAGTLGGGIRYLKNLDSGELSPTPSFSVFPNPVVAESGVLNVRSDRAVIVSLWSATGAQVSAEFAIPGNKVVNIADYVKNINPGLYIIKARQNANAVFRRVIVIN